MKVNSLTFDNLQRSAPYLNVEFVKLGETQVHRVFIPRLEL